MAGVYHCLQEGSCEGLYHRRMVIDATAVELSSSERLTEFLRAFEACTIRKEEWTHAAHVAMAAGYLLEKPVDEALDAARRGIQKFNAHHGGPPEKYHETLTRFWVYVCAAYLQEVGLPDAEGVRALIATYGRRSDLYREYYSYDALTSQAARQSWQPPDEQPLPGAWRRGELLISTNRRMLQIGVIHGFLKESYWAKGIPVEVVARCLRGAVCFGMYESGRQIGFARVVTDLATYGYVADVFVVESERGRGLAKWMMQCVMSHPSLQGFRRWQLATRDAHELYRKCGFAAVGKPEGMMEIARPDMYLGG